MAAGLVLVVIALVMYWYYPAEVVFPVLIAAMGAVSLYWGGKAFFSD